MCPLQKTETQIKYNSKFKVCVCVCVWCGLSNSRTQRKLNNSPLGVVGDMSLSLSCWGSYCWGWLNAQPWFEGVSGKIPQEEPLSVCANVSQVSSMAHSGLAWSHYHPVQTVSWTMLRRRWKFSERGEKLCARKAFPTICLIGHPLRSTLFPQNCEFCYLIPQFSKSLKTKVYLKGFTYIFPPMM